MIIINLSIKKKFIYSFSEKALNLVLMIVVRILASCKSYLLIQKVYNTKIKLVR